MRVLYWFNNDLRTRDNEALKWVAKHATDVVFCYFKPKRPVGPFRLTFLKETLIDLNQSLQTHGHRLHYISNFAQEELPQICRKNQIDCIVFSEDVGFYEKQEQQYVRTVLGEMGLKVKSVFQDTLIDKLPFPIEKLPHVFTEFRKKVEPVELQANSVEINLSVIKSINLDSDFNINFDCEAKNKIFTGGESHALKRLKHFIWESQAILNYKETRNGMIHLDDSSKFSPWFANGSLSPRTVFKEVQKFEEEVQGNDSTYWLIFELLWRDYFKFLALKYPTQIYQIQGLSKVKKYFESDSHALSTFESWKEGQTSSNFINANMKELLQTGWMSNRGRQNVASYLAKTLKVNWTWGARWFEHQLIDYDPAVNWGNWMYLAGVGTDPRDREFNVERQAAVYDPNGEYQRLWLKK